MARAISNCKKAFGIPGWVQARMQQTLIDSHIYHPNIQTVEADKQMYLWTKSVPVETPPPIFTTTMEEIDLEPIKFIMNTTILASRLYEKREVKMKYKNKPKDLTRGTHEYFPSSLLQNQFKNVMGYAKAYPQVYNLNPCCESRVAATWKVKGENFSVHGQPGTYINSKRPMPLFYGKDYVEESKGVPVTSLGPIDPFIDIKKYLVKDTSCSGLYPDKSLFPHFHTLLVLDNGEYKPPPSSGVPEVQLIQKALLFTFCRLLSQAISKYGNEIIGNVLPEPECGQSIITDGNRFSFLWFQLNTLDMSDLEEGVKNLVCVERPGEVFSSVVEETKHRHRLDDFKEDILRMYLSMFVIS